MSGGEEAYDNPEDMRESDTMKILLATDCHLGYELDTKRLQESDSFITFEEILQHAVNNNVDFVLLGGDLFHANKPAQNVVVRCMDLLKKYTQGDRPIEFEFLNNPEVVFSQSHQQVVNFEDPNLNIALPVFSIHGNHDNPNLAATGSLDLLGASGFVNYFGKWSGLTEVKIPPIVLRKGETHICLYGLSYMNDQRLSRLFRDNKVTLLRPTGISDPFNIFVLHQNRSKHTANGYVPEDKLPEFIDLVFWGHEHKCRIEPEDVMEPGTTSVRYHITQPGSSVATSLCEGEAVEKNIGLLKVNRNRFRIDPIKLKTVRPFVFHDLHLSSVDIPESFGKTRALSVYKFVDDYIETVLLPKAELQRTDHPEQPKLPLIRLRLFYSEEDELFDTMILTRKYCDMVANPRDMILFRKDRVGPITDNKKNIFDMDDGIESEMHELFRAKMDGDGTALNWDNFVPEVIQSHLEGKKKKFSIMNVGGLNRALKRYVEVADDTAFSEIIEYQVKKNTEYLMRFQINNKDAVNEQLMVFRDEKAANENEEIRQVDELLANKSRNICRGTAKKQIIISSNDSDENDEDKVDEEPRPTRGRGSRGSVRRGKGRGNGSKTPVKAVRGRGKQSTNIFEDTGIPSTSRAPNKRAAGGNDIWVRKAMFSMILGRFCSAIVLAMEKMHIHDHIETLRSSGRMPSPTVKKNSQYQNTYRPSNRAGNACYL